MPASKAIRFGPSLVPFQYILGSVLGFLLLSQIQRRRYLTAVYSLLSNFYLHVYLLGGGDSGHSAVGFHSAHLRSRLVGNQCNYRSNYVCLMNCYHRNVCSVVCVGVGNIFTQPLAGNGRLRRLHYSGFVGRNVDSLSCMKYVSCFSYCTPILSTSYQAPQLAYVTANQTLWVI
jgi:hypothetical protein